jgi:MFS family permease
VHHVTRNLLVGSHYGLELNRRLQWAIPAFRSVYQTSLFFGCLKALHDHPESIHGATVGSPPASGAEGTASSSSPLAIRWDSPEINAPANPRPLVFEIGHSRAHPLTDPGHEGLHPEAYRRSLRMESFRWLSLAFLVVAVGALGRMLLPVLMGRHRRFAVVATGSFLLLLAVALSVAGRWVGFFTLLSVALLWAATRSLLRDQMKHGLGAAAATTFLLSLGLAAGGVSGWVGLLALPMAALAWVVTRPSLRNWMRSPLVLLAAVFIPIVTLAVVDHCSSEGEPFSVFEGVSSWPTILLRITAAAYCVIALIRADQADQESMRKLRVRYYLQKARFKGIPHAAGALGWRTLVRTLRRGRAWKDPVGSLTAKGGEVNPMTLWVRYGKLSRCDRVTARVLGYFLLYFVFCLALTGLYGLPNNPYRGTLNCVVDEVVRWTAIILTVLLLASVFDATRLCSGLIKVLMDRKTDWPPEVPEQAASELGVDLRLLKPTGNGVSGAVDRKDDEVSEAVKCSLEQYADLTFLSEHTAVVGRRVYDAAIACLLMFLARSPFFDQYVMSWSMILIYAVALAVVFACGAYLRYTAREARRKGREKVRDALYRLRTVPGRGAAGSRVMPEGGAPIVELSAFRTEGAALELVDATRRAHVVDRAARAARRRSRREDAVHALERIDRGLDQVRTGAFSKLIDDPFLHTLVLILSGYGALLSLEPIRMLLQHVG